MPILDLVSRSTRLRSLLLSLTLLLLAASAPGTFAQDWAGHYERNTFLSAPASVFGDGLLGYVHPANAYLARGDARLYWTTEGTEYGSVDDWGFFAGGEGVSFGTLTRRALDFRATDYRLSVGFGDRGLTGGLAYQWTGGDGEILGLHNMVSGGVIARPNPHFSAGLTANVFARVRAWEAVGEIGLRPFGTPRATLFADAALREGLGLADAPWSAGAAVEVGPGLRIVSRYLDGGPAREAGFTAGIRLDFGRAGGGGHVQLDEDADATGATYFLRAGGFTPDALGAASGEDERQVEIELDGRIGYRNPPLAGLFGERSPRLYEVLDLVESAAQDERVGLIAIRLAGAEILPEHAWEIREALRRARESGTTVVVFLEDVGMTGYHLASVADHVVIDPMGTLLLPGYLSNTTYLAEALEKLGLGFEAWRYFEYKSAVEPLSRREMSEADRRQRQAYVDDIYTQVRGEVIASRSLEAAAFDRAVDEQTIFRAEEAIEAGLADTLGRWHERDDLIETLTDADRSTLAGDRLLADRRVHRQWGRPGRVALVYGLGATMRSSGMNARSLAETIRELGENEKVDAIVFRVDSPGGDPLAADLVAEALRTASEEKPVIVTQGQVAGSGGYWVSMYGDRILAGPSTVTGSIGVIGGWLFDEGFSDRLGLSADHVQRGERADLTAGVSLPFVQALPERNLTDEEQERIRAHILALYDEFVRKVAEGRDTTESDVREVAEGRIYSGEDGVAAGLVDEIGGLTDAIRIARAESTIPTDRPFEVEEYGGRPSFFGSGFGSGLGSGVGSGFGSGIGPGWMSGTISAIGARLGGAPAPNASGMEPALPSFLEDPNVAFLRMMAEHQPSPLLILRPGLYPTYEARGLAE